MASCCAGIIWFRDHPRCSTWSCAVEVLVPSVSSPASVGLALGGGGRPIDKSTTRGRAAKDNKSRYKSFDSVTSTRGEVGRDSNDASESDSVCNSSSSRPGLDPKDEEER